MPKYQLKGPILGAGQTSVHYGFDSDGTVGLAFFPLKEDKMPGEAITKDDVAFPKEDAIIPALHFANIDTMRTFGNALIRYADDLAKQKESEDGPEHPEA